MILGRLRISRLLPSYQHRMMNSSSSKLIHFGPFEVTDQVFYNTKLCYGLINIKPVLPGHVLVIPYRHVQRLTDLTPDEVTDIFVTVQKVQKMLAKQYFKDADGERSGKVETGSFNVALQDGKEAGQTVPHVHVHIIPRTVEDASLGDAIYEKLQGEEGNVGGGYYDQDRPKQIGKFPKVDDADRKPRSPEEMKKQAIFFREQMALVE